MIAKISRNASIIVLSSNLWNFADGMLGPLFAVFAQRVGGNILEISWAWGVYLIIMGVGTMVVGSLSDKYSKKHIMFAGYVIQTISTFGYLLVHSADMLFIVQGGMGLAAALANPTHYALISKYTRASERDGAMWGMAAGRDKIALGLAVFVGGLIVSTSSFTVLFTAMGIVSLISTLYLYRIFYGEH